MLKLRIPLLCKIFRPTVMRSVIRIDGVLLIRTCFLLERDCPIRLVRVTDNQETNEPFQHIPEVKEDVQHFLHLLGMDLFMNYRLLREGFVSSDKQHSKEVYCNESLWRDKVISNYLHNFIFFKNHHYFRRTTYRHQIQDVFARTIGYS